MTLRFTILGFEVAQITLEIEPADKIESAVDRGVKGISRLWVRHMVR